MKRKRKLERSQLEQQADLTGLAAHSTGAFPQEEKPALKLQSVAVETAFGVTLWSDTTWGGYVKLLASTGRTEDGYTLHYTDRLSTTEHVVRYALEDIINVSECWVKEN